MHLADVHAGLLTASTPDPATGLQSALLSIDRCLGAAFDKAIAESVDGVIIAGDVFHAASPDAAALALFGAQLQRLRGAGIPVLLIAGNHDRAPHPGQPSVLEAFRQPGVVVSVVPEIVSLGDARVATLPSVSRHQLMTSEYGSRYVLQVDEKLVEGLRAILDAFRAEASDVLTGHWPVAGSMLGLERDIAVIDEPMLAPSDVAGPWSYAALGHIHKRQELANEAAAYSGSIDRMNFGEEDEPKGGYIVDIGAEHRHVSLTSFESPARPFLTIDLDSNRDVAIDPADVEGAIVRLRGDYLTWIDKVDGIRKVFLDAGAALVRLDLQRGTRVAVRSAAAADAPGPLEALDAYLEHREVPEDDRPPIRARAHDLVEGSV